MAVFSFAGIKKLDARSPQNYVFYGFFWARVVIIRDYQHFSHILYLFLMKLV